HASNSGDSIQQQTIDTALEITTGQLKDRNGTFNINLERIVGYLHGSIPSIPVTLDDCYYKILPTIGGNSKPLIRINRAFIGVQYDQDETPSFNTLTFSIEGIDDWIQTSGIKVEYPSEKCPVIISYEPQEDVSLNLDNGMQLLIIWSPSSKHSFNKKAEITEKIYFKLVSQSAHELDEFVSVARKITEFLCFAMNETVSLDSISATSDDLFKEIEGGKPIPISIDVYYQSWPYAKDEPKVNLYNMLFRFKEIQNDVERTINNWLKGYEYSAPAFRLYFLAKIGTQTYLEEKCLTLVQGLEAYHRKMFNENRMNLRNRIERIIEPFKDIIGTDEEQQELITGIMDTRNYLTHYNPSKELKAVKGVNLWPLGMKMELLFELHFLQLIGFSREKIDSIVDNCPGLKRKLNW
ncbi:MAG: hypothetical protein OXU51_22525, partial [Candidatus Poribacteria bacterium]|nr:hypothetical protein [Candidatus Poribacteria bacterium]